VYESIYTQGTLKITGQFNSPLRLTFL